MESHMQTGKLLINNKKLNTKIICTFTQHALIFTCSAEVNVVTCK